MRALLIFTTMVTWALWLGATIAIFVFGLHFRSSLPDAIFREAAHSMFQVFDNYELILAGLLLVGSALLVINFPSKAVVLLLGCVVLSGGMAVTAALGLMPRMEMLREEGKTASIEFKKTHGKYMAATSMQAGMLLLSGAVLLSEVIGGRRQPIDHNIDEPIEPAYDKRAELSQRV